jgi:hypothetical protein
MCPAWSREPIVNGQSLRRERLIACDQVNGNPRLKRLANPTLRRLAGLEGVMEHTAQVRAGLGHL